VAARERQGREREAVGGGIHFSPGWCFRPRLKGPLLSWVETPPRTKDGRQFITSLVPFFITKD
jgi:hypothetical protein